MKLIMALLSLILVGCAGLHSTPPNNYSSSSDPSTIRVSFDQYGDIYPSSPETKMPEQKYFGFNHAFSIKNFLENNSHPYNDDLIEQRYSNIATQIVTNARRHQGSKIVFLIHGFNNSFEEASDSYEKIKSFMRLHSKTHFIFVEIYWDGLYKGPFSFPLPLAYWFDSLTYSNIAGQVGLRRLFNDLPDNSHISIITHSRGAGVALSALHDPVYDSHITVPHFEELNPNKIGKVNLISIAPAVGTGHLFSDMPDNIKQSSQFFIGFNENDPALQKSIKKFGVDSQNFGDTSLGTDDSFYLEIEKKLNKNSKVIQRVKYENYHSHSFDGYIQNEEKTKCLLWASELIDENPDGCQLKKI